MITDPKIVEQAKALVGTVDVTEYPDLHSHLTTFQARVDAGDETGQQAFARAVVKLAVASGIELPEPEEPEPEEPSKAELQAEAEALGLAKSGTKDEIAARIAEHKAAQES